MSNLEEFAEKLNNQRPIDIEALAEAFDQVFYTEPEGKDPIEAEHVKGLCIRSTGSIEELIEKLETAREAEPDFVRIDDHEYDLDSDTSFRRLIDGIRIGTEHG